MKIYIGNIHQDVTETQLRDLFKTFGKVNSVNIITDMATGISKGFGFVEMDDQTDGQQALKGLNNTSFMGQNIEISEARPPEPKDSRFVTEAREKSKASQARNTKRR